MRAGLLRRFISILLSVSLLAVEGVFPYAPGRLADFYPPRSTGRVRPPSAPPRPPASRTVFFIQDVHRNLEAQSNIARALQSLVDRNVIDLIALEGAFGPIDLAPYRLFPDRRAMAVAADDLLARHDISGPVHMALSSERTPPPLEGIDDRSGYRRNVDAYRRAAGRKSEAERSLALAERANAARRAALFNPDLRAFDDRLQRHRSGQTSWSDHLAYLAEISGGAPPNVQRYLDALALERKLDFAHVERERSDLVRALAERLSPAGRGALLDLSRDFRRNDVDYESFHERLRTLCAQARVSLAATPAFVDYLRYVRLASGVDAARMFDDAALMEAAAEARLARSADERALLAESRRLYYTRKLLNFALTASEWRAYRSLRAHGPFAPALVDAEIFYREAEARDTAMAANLLQAMDRRRTKTAAVVAGGFHSGGIESALRAAGVEVIVFSPAVSSIGDGSAYLTAFTRERAPLDRIFEGEKLFIADSPIRPTTPFALAMRLECLVRLAAGACVRLIAPKIARRLESVTRTTAGGRTAAVATFPSGQAYVQTYDPARRPAFEESARGPGFGRLAHRHLLYSQWEVVYSWMIPVGSWAITRALPWTAPYAPFVAGVAVALIFASRHPDLTGSRFFTLTVVQLALGSPFAFGLDFWAATAISMAAHLAYGVVVIVARALAPAGSAWERFVDNWLPFASTTPGADDARNATAQRIRDAFAAAMQPGAQPAILEDIDPILTAGQLHRRFPNPGEGILKERYSVGIPNNATGVSLRIELIGAALALTFEWKGEAPAHRRRARIFWENGAWIRGWERAAAAITAAYGRLAPADVPIGSIEDVGDVSDLLIAGGAFSNEFPFPNGETGSRRVFWGGGDDTDASSLRIEKTSFGFTHWYRAHGTERGDFESRLYVENNQHVLPDRFERRLLERAYADLANAPVGTRITLAAPLFGLLYANALGEVFSLPSGAVSKRRLHFGAPLTTDDVRLEIVKGEGASLRFELFPRKKGESDFAAKPLVLDWNGTAFEGWEDPAPAESSETAAQRVRRLMALRKFQEAAKEYTEQLENIASFWQHWVVNARFLQWTMESGRRALLESPVFYLGSGPSISHRAWSLLSDLIQRLGVNLGPGVDVDFDFWNLFYSGERFDAENVPADRRPAAVQADMKTLPFADNSVGRVENASITLVDDVTAAIREANRVLVRGGALILMTNSKSFSEDFVRSLSRMGFDVAEHRPIRLPESFERELLSNEGDKDALRADIRRIKSKVEIGGEYIFAVKREDSPKTDPGDLSWAFIGEEREASAGSGSSPATPAPYDLRPFVRGKKLPVPDVKVPAVPEPEAPLTPHPSERAVTFHSLSQERRASVVRLAEAVSRFLSGGEAPQIPASEPQESVFRDPALAPILRAMAESRQWLIRQFATNPQDAQRAGIEFEHRLAPVLSALSGLLAANGVFLDRDPVVAELVPWHPEILTTGSVRYAMDHSIRPVMDARLVDGVDMLMTGDPIVLRGESAGVGFAYGNWSVARPRELLGDTMAALGARFAVGHAALEDVHRRLIEKDLALALGSVERGRAELEAARAAVSSPDPGPVLSGWVRSVHYANYHVIRLGNQGELPPSVRSNIMMYAVLLRMLDNDMVGRGFGEMLIAYSEEKPGAARVIQAMAQANGMAPEPFIESFVASYLASGPSGVAPMIRATLDALGLPVFISPSEFATAYAGGAVEFMKGSAVVSVPVAAAAPSAVAAGEVDPPVLRSAEALAASLVRFLRGELATVDVPPGPWRAGAGNPAAAMASLVALRREQDSISGAAPAVRAQWLRRFDARVSPLLRELSGFFAAHGILFDVREVGIAASGGDPRPVIYFSVDRITRLVRWGGMEFILAAGSLGRSVKAESAVRRAGNRTVVWSDVALPWLVRELGGVFGPTEDPTARLRQAMILRDLQAVLADQAALGRFMQVARDAAQGFPVAASKEVEVVFNALVTQLFYGAYHEWRLEQTGRAINSVEMNENHIMWNLYLGLFFGRELGDLLERVAQTGARAVRLISRLAAANGMKEGEFTRSIADSYVRGQTAPVRPAIRKALDEAKLPVFVEPEEFMDGLREAAKSEGSAVDLAVAAAAPVIVFCAGLWWAVSLPALALASVILVLVAAGVNEAGHMAELGWRERRFVLPRFGSDGALGLRVYVPGARGWSGIAANAAAILIALSAFALGLVDPMAVTLVIAANLIFALGPTDVADTIGRLMEEKSASMGVADVRGSARPAPSAAIGDVEIVVTPARANRPRSIRAMRAIAAGA